MTAKNWLRTTDSHVRGITVTERVTLFDTSRIKHVFSRIIKFHSIYIRSIRFDSMFCFFCLVRIRLCSVLFHWEDFLPIPVRGYFTGFDWAGWTGIIHQIERWKINKLKLFRVPFFAVCCIIVTKNELSLTPSDLGKFEWPHVTFLFHLTRGAWWKFQNGQFKTGNSIRHFIGYSGQLPPKTSLPRFKNR